MRAVPILAVLSRGGVCGVPGGCGKKSWLWPGATEGIEGPVVGAAGPATGTTGPGDASVPAGSREFLDIIVEEVNRLNKIVSQFLDYARPYRGDQTPLVAYPACSSPA